MDAVEIWSSIHYDAQGRVTRREPAGPVSMTMIFVQQGGTWLLDNTRYYADAPLLISSEKVPTHRLKRDPGGLAA